MSRRNIRVFCLLSSAFCLLFVTGCRKNSETAEQKALPAAEKSQGTQVSVTKARTGSIADTIIVTGSLTSKNDVIVGVKTNGKVIAVYKREGDTVTAGEVVAQQDPTDLQNQLDQQLANLATAKTKLTQADAAYDNAVTNLKLTRDQTASAVRQAQAGLDAARQELTIMKQGARQQERQQSEESLASAKADRDKARSDLKRYQDLYRQQAVSAQQLDQAQASADSAEAKYNSAAQALSLIRAGNRPEDVRRSQASVEQANQTLITAQANRDQIALRQADVENAVATRSAAVAGIAQAQAAVRLAQQALRDTKIVSPITGVVAERKVEPGMQVVTAKADVMRIVDLRNMYFDGVLSESQYASVVVGQRVAVSANAFPSRTFEGHIEKLFPVASAARSFTARVTLVNDNNLLRPQMFATGKITLETVPNAVLVSRDAILDANGDDGRVFVASADGKAEERKVKTGITSGNLVQIVSGVKDGEQVVTTGQGQLQSGERLNVIPVSAPSEPQANAASP